MDLTHYNLDAFNALLQLRRERRISWRAFGLGMVIASFANRDAGEAWPSRAMLESISGIESRDIPRVTCELRDAGFMAIEEREGRSNIYRLTHGETAACGDLAAVGKQPPTCGERAEKPVGKQPPITMKEQSRNNQGKATRPAYRETTACGDSNDAATNRTDEPGDVDAAPKKKKAPAPTAKATLSATGFVVPDKLLAAWYEAYPRLDVEREISVAFAWFVADGQKKKNIERFLCNWLSRSEKWRQEREGPPEAAYTEEQLRINRERGEAMLEEERRRIELGIPDWEECPA